MIYIKRKKQKGIAILYAIAVSALFLIMLSWSSRYLLESISNSTKEFQKSGLAVNIAKAGAEDAYFWFTRQSTQPVNYNKMITKYDGMSPLPDLIASYSGGTAKEFFGYPDSAFYPKYDPNPNLSETDDESIGLVRDYEIDKNKSLYGHYEVKRQSKNNNPSNIVPGVNNMYPGDPNSNINDAVHDISALTSTQNAGEGNIWRIVSRGYVYRRSDFTKNANGDGTFAVKYNQAPNVIIDESKISTDILKIGVNASITRAAIVTTNLSNVDKCSTCDVGNINISGTTGISVIAGSGTNINSSVASGIKTGTLGLKEINPYLNLSVSNVFTITESELKGISNSIDTPNDLKLNDKGYLGNMAIIFANKDITFGKSTKPLKGGGLLYVKGNLTIQRDSGSFFSGIIYATGNVTVEGDNAISGCIILAGPTSKFIAGGGNNKVYVDYSQKVIEVVQKQLATYRTNNFSYRVYDSNK